MPFLEIIVDFGVCVMRVLWLCLKGRVLVCQKYILKYLEIKLDDVWNLLHNDWGRIKNKNSNEERAVVS